MSQKRKHTIYCPKCRHEQEVELFDSINVKSEPEFKDRLLANQLNTVTCEQCELAFRVDIPLVYNDPERRVIIYCLPAEERLREEGQRQFSDNMKQVSSLLPKGTRTPQVHLVFSRAELVERIFLVEAGLNERIVEYIKYLIYSKNMRKVDPQEKILLFDAQDSTDEALCFVVQDARSRKIDLVMKYDRKTYGALVEMFDKDEQTATLLELFPGPYVNARLLFLKEPARKGSQD